MNEEQDPVPRFALKMRVGLPASDSHHCINQNDTHPTPPITPSKCIGYSVFVRDIFQFDEMTPDRSGHDFRSDHDLEEISSPIHPWTDPLRGDLVSKIRVLLSPEDRTGARTHGLGEQHIDL